MSEPILSCIQNIWLHRRAIDLLLKRRASITIKYANKGLGLQKPIVVVEGFESALKPYGVISYEGLASGIILNGNDERVFLGMEKLSWMYDSLHCSGYDIVHVDFRGE